MTQKLSFTSQELSKMKTYLKINESLESKTSAVSMAGHRMRILVLAIRVISVVRKRKRKRSLRSA